MTWVKRIGVGLLVVALLVVAAVGIRLLTMPGRTAALATKTLNSNQAFFDEEADELLASVAGTVGAEADAVSRGYRCEIARHEQGWFVMDHSQVCDHLLVAWFPVEDADGLLREHGPSTTVSSCPRLDLPVLDDRRYQGSAAHLVTRGAEDECRSAGVDEPEWYVSLDDPAGIMPDGQPDDLGDAEQWVRLRWDREFMRKRLGCGVKIIFCTQPMADPAMPSA